MSPQAWGKNYQVCFNTFSPTMLVEPTITLSLYYHVIPRTGSGSECLRVCLRRPTRLQSVPVSIESIERRRYSSASSMSESVESPLSNSKSDLRSGSDRPG